jgi:hypothetical protein
MACKSPWKAAAFRTRRLGLDREPTKDGYFDMNIPGLENGFLRWQRYERADSDLAVSLRRRVTGELRALMRQHSPAMLKGPMCRNRSARQLESGSKAD